MKQRSGALRGGSAGGVLGVYLPALSTTTTSQLWSTMPMYLFGIGHVVCLSLVAAGLLQPHQLQPQAGLAIHTACIVSCIAGIWPCLLHPGLVIAGAQL